MKCIFTSIFATDSVFEWILCVLELLPSPTLLVEAQLCQAKLLQKPLPSNYKDVLIHSCLVRLQSHHLQPNFILIIKLRGIIGKWYRVLRHTH